MKILFVIFIIIFYAVYMFIYYYPKQELKMLNEEIDKRDCLIKELKQRIYVLERDNKKKNEKNKGYDKKRT